LIGALAAPAGAASNDPYFGRQWSHQQIRAEQAWATTNGAGAVIAVVDTGIDLTHPDLQANLIVNSNADFAEPEGNCTIEGGKWTCVQDGPQDEHGHGTHVAGIIGAIANNGIGVAGVAPGARILAVRVLGEDGRQDDPSRIAAGIRYAADNGADVINVSLGFSVPEGEVRGAIAMLDPIYLALEHAWSKGAVVLVAAGNDTAPLCGEPASGHHVLCVGATDSRGLMSLYSNYDATLIDAHITAPGGDGGSVASLGATSPTAAACAGDIFSTYLRGATTWCSGESGYDAAFGTSMATPHASGVAGLLAAKGLTNQQIVNCLLRTGDDLGAPGRDPIYGFGRVNALRAVTSC
jgi:subtilisin family serine protease